MEKFSQSVENLLQIIQELQEENKQLSRLAELVLDENQRLTEILSRKEDSYAKGNDTFSAFRKS